MPDMVDIAYTFPRWADVDPEDGIAFKALLKAEAVSIKDPPGVAFRMALLRDGAHADAVARGGEPDTVYVRAVDAEQVRRFAAQLLRAADLASAS